MYVPQVIRPQTLVWSCMLLFLVAQVVPAQEGQKPNASKKPDETKKSDEAKKLDAIISPVILADGLEYGVTVYPGARLAYLDESYSLALAVEDNGLGADVTPAEGALRSHLDLPKDQGLVVTNVHSGGAAEKAGLQKHDVVLTVGGKPVVTPEGLNEQLKAAGEKAVAVSLLRAGKKLTVEVTPKRGQAYSELVLHHYESLQGNRFWIGVTASEADETLRAQLRLPEKRGLVVTEVKEDSPAKKAGILVNDVLLEFGGKPMGTVEDLSKQVQETAEKPASMKLLRSGQQQALQVTPAKRPEETGARLLRRITLQQGHALNLVTERQRLHNWLVPAERGRVNALVDLANLGNLAAPPRDARAELADLLQEVRKLNQRIEALDRSLKAADKAPVKDEKKK